MPLHYASVKGHKRVIEILLANKAEIDAQASNGLTSLCLAVKNGHKDVAELLRKYGGHE
jgi:ankyrin repeat protein